MRRRFHVCVLTLVGVLLVACGGGQPPSGDVLSGSVRIAGSSTVYPISTAVAEEFQKRHREVNASVSSTGTGGGFSNFFCTGKTDINDASRPIKPEEREQCETNGVDPVEFQIATDAITVVVNKDADWIQCLTVEELRTIWRPDNPAQTWNDVRPGWPDEPLSLYGPASTSGTFDYFTEVVMGAEDAHRSDYQATEHDNTIVQAVSGSKYTMGYFGYAYYSQNPDRVKAVAINSGAGCVEPSLESAQAGEYQPLSRPLYIYVDRNALRREPVRSFVRFYLERSSTNLISQVGYVPVTESIMRGNLESEMLGEQN